MQLSKQQKEAVEHQAGPAAVYAGPGSGKTRVVTLRAARLIAQGERVLVTTFTNEAADEMRRRLTALGTGRTSNAAVSTLHAFCLALLKSEGVEFQLLTDPMQQRTIAEMAGAAEVDGGVRAFLDRVTWCKNQGESAAVYKPENSQEDRLFARVWKSYQQALGKKKLKDFDDLVLDARDLLESADEARSRAASRFDQIIVDESQDMNNPQFAVVLALGRDHKNLMLVGDPDQSLYAFRGADPRTFQRFAAHAATRVYELRANYRSTRSIIAFADALIRQEEGRRALAFEPMRTQGAAVQWERYDDADEEAEAIAVTISDLHKKGVAYREMAVLFRTNAQSEAFERIFAEQNIPFMNREEGDFYARREVQGLLSWLYYLSPAGEHGQLHADEWLLAILNVPDRGIARPTGPELVNFASLRGKNLRESLTHFYAPDLKTHKGIRQLLQELERLEPEASRCTDAGKVLERIRAVTDYDRRMFQGRHAQRDRPDNDRLQNIQRLQEAASHYPDAPAFLQAVQRVREARQRGASAKKRKNDRDEVTLTTGHGAKGLEWRCVFAAGWSETILPHRKAEDMNEERRIAYVIATRARDLLHVSSLNRWNDLVVAPSRFLTGLNLAASPLAAGGEEPAESLELEGIQTGLFAGD